MVLFAEGVPAAATVPVPGPPAEAESRRREEAAVVDDVGETER